MPGPFMRDLFKQIGPDEPKTRAGRARYHFIGGVVAIAVAVAVGVILFLQPAHSVQLCSNGGTNCHSYGAGGYYLLVATFCGSFVAIGAGNIVYSWYLVRHPISMREAKDFL